MLFNSLQYSKKYIVIIFIIYTSALSSQTEKEINNQGQFWTSINSTTRLTNRWGVLGDFHIRRTDFIKDPNFYFLRAGVVYWLDDVFSIAAGPAVLWLATPIDDNFEYALEKRLFQQVLWRSSIGKVGFLQRIRIEQRWHEVLDENGSVDRMRFSTRARFLFSFNFKVFEDPKMPKIVTADEILFHFGDEITYNTFNQNRLFLGISQRINKNMTFDFGYMNVYQQKYSGYQYDRNHTLRLFFYYSPDLRKKKDADLPHYPIGGSE